MQVPRRLHAHSQLATMLDMANFRVPENVEIASLKKKQETFFDAMAAGPGNVWEDRGTHGTVSAFFKTCIASITAPAKLVDNIRRPETNGDTRIFLWGCAALWGISVIIHMLLLYPHYSHLPNTEFDSQIYFEYIGIGVAAAVLGTYVLFRLFNKVYTKLLAQEKTHRPLPDVLVYNVTAYCLGPSLLALIPVVGPPIALLLIFIDVVIVGKKRLNIRATGAFIDAILPMIAVVVLIVVGWLVGRLILHVVPGDPITLLPPPKIK